MAYDVELFVIGAGSAGVRAARLAGASGAKVMVAEEDRIGGTCVIRGCVPKKFFVYASEYGQALEDMRGYGWTVEGATFDWPTLRDNVAGDVARLSQIYETNMRKQNVEVVHERAEIAGPHAVRLKSGRTVTAERILVAAGGRPVRPQIPGGKHAIVSDDAFHLAALPKRIVILGGGYIACEFAHIYSGLGVTVTQLYRRNEPVLRGFDDEIRAHVQADMIRSGIDIRAGINITAIEKRGEEYVCALTNGESLTADLVLFATGRAPHTAGLGLEAAGVATRENGAIIVNDFSETNVPSIYAVGDVTDRINLTPVAIREGQAFADTIYYNRPTAFDHAYVPSAVFTSPPVGAVGLTEAQARQTHHHIDIYKTSFRPMKYVLAGNFQRTLMKLVVCSEDDVVLGVHIAGIDAPELIQLAAIAVRAKLTKAQWDATCAVHPTAAEELVTLREKARDPADAPVEKRHVES
jgi:glutathione reductase (NADPH)